MVEYQQALQTVSDPLLGWTTVGDHQYYVRQFRDMKGASRSTASTPAALADYAGICGYLLAKGHARTSGASMIAGYIGGRTSWTTRCAGSPGRTPTRPNATTKRWWTPSPARPSCRARGVERRLEARVDRLMHQPPRPPPGFVRRHSSTAASTGAGIWQGLPIGRRD